LPFGFHGLLTGDLFLVGNMNGAYWIYGFFYDCVNDVLNAMEQKKNGNIINQVRAACVMKLDQLIVTLNIGGNDGR